jgi:hypothetical protein
MCADITKNSFREENLHTSVVFQRGRDIHDFELNELQDILRTQQYRALLAESGGLNPGSNDDGFLAVGANEINEVTIKAGSLFCDGIPIILHEDLDYTFGPGQVITIYLTVGEAEAPDPAQVPQVGETTRRRKLVLELNWIAGTILPVNSVEEIWQGGTRHFAIARVDRATGIQTVAPEDVTDLRKRLPAYVINQWMNQYATIISSIDGSTDDYNPPGISDAFVVRLSSSAPITITGLTSDVQYKRKTLINVGAHTITFAVESALSQAKNRFTAQVALEAGDSIDVVYDGIAERWVFVKIRAVLSAAMISFVPAEGAVGADDVQEALEEIPDFTIEKLVSTPHVWTANQTFTSGYISNHWGVSGEVLYADPATGAPTPKRRMDPIPLQVQPGWMRPLSVGTFPVPSIQKVPSANEEIYSQWLKLPRDSVLQEVHVRANLPGGLGSDAKMKVGVYRITGNYPDSGINFKFFIDTTSPPNKVFVGDAININHAFNPENEFLFFHYEASSNSTNSDAINSFIIVWDDAGPSSSIGY